MTVTERRYFHPTDLGNIALLAHYADDGTVTGIEITHADPRVLISGELLRNLHQQKPEPTLPHTEVDHPGVGGILKIHGTNQNLIYRIIRTHTYPDGFQDPDVYVGEWPD